jgi:glucose 1-dehydrogenase
MKGLQDKVALVTGGSSGIGQAIAIRLGEEGASVAINYVGRPEGAITTQEAIEHGVEMCMKKVTEAGGRPILVEADVSDEQAVTQMYDQVMREYGRLDILVNNAGIQIAGDSDELSAADFDKVLAVNLRGAFLCARQAVRSFLAAERPGVIVNVSSVHQVIPKPRFLGYSVSKGGMQNLTRSLALEYAARGIRVNGIGPGATVTPINRSWIDDPVKRRMVEEHIPMRRAGGAEEMAAAAAFLCSDEAAYITGQTLFIDGGLTLYPSFETTWSSELPGVAGRAAPERRPPGYFWPVPAITGRYRRKRNPSCSHSDRICQPGPDGRAGPAKIRLASPPASSGDTVRHSSSSRPAAASCPFRVGPPSASTRAYPRSASAPSAAARFTSRSPAMITSARSAAFLRSSAGASATVITIGGVTAAVKKGESQSSRQERESTATGTANGP